MASRVTSRLRRRTHKPVSEDNVTPIEPARRERARKLLELGRTKAGIAALREMAESDRTGAGWVRLAAALSHCGRTDDAIDALKQGAHFHRRLGDRRKAAVVAGLIARLQARQPVAA